MRWEPFEISEKEKEYGYTYGKRSEDGAYEMMVGVVMYGYRVYVRLAGNMMFFEKDLCGGADAKQVQILYSWVETHLSKDIPMETLLSEIPQLNIKPYFNDIEFMREFTELVAHQSPKLNDITQEGLQKGRDILFNSFKEK